MKDQLSLFRLFIAAIRKFNINKAISVNYVSDDDKRSKNLVVTEKVSFEGATWDLLLTITDAESEKNSDGGKGLQIFWNKTTNVNGIAIIKPYNCNRTKDANLPNAILELTIQKAKVLLMMRRWSLPLLVFQPPDPTPINSPSIVLRCLREEKEMWWMFTGIAIIRTLSCFQIPKDKVLIGRLWLRVQTPTILA